MKIENIDMEDVFAITEVKYIIDNLNVMDRDKIPYELYNFFSLNFDINEYKNLNITDDNINRISPKGKIFLKIVEIFLK